MLLTTAITLLLAASLTSARGAHYPSSSGPPAPFHSGSNSPPPPCRFAKRYSQASILANSSAFISDWLYWENRFHANNISYNTANGMSYDGTLLDFVTGQATEKHPFSAASKEALQIMIYAQVLSGSPSASRFIAPDRPWSAPRVVTDILTKKLATYTAFNTTYPGFGGLLPWFLANETAIRPTSDWVNRIPALDNGELLWAVYGLIEALNGCEGHEQRALATGWEAWLDYAKGTAATLFYRGEGEVCAVTDLKNQSAPFSSTGAQNYTCENSDRLDDPYEGELMTWWLYFFGGLAESDKEALWAVKRKKLVSVEYNMGGVGPITVQQGFWFSSHEVWKVLEMPYLDVDLVRRIHDNGERARTCNSVVTHVPGMFASVNNITDPTTGEIVSYISPAGIPSIASQKDQYLEVITPYSVWPTLLADRNVALAWLWNMLLGKKMQNPYGTTESTRIDGTGVSAFVSWDSKILTVAALSGGVQDLVRRKLKGDGLYDEFIAVVQREHERVFTEIKGEDVQYCLPDVGVSDAGLEDFTLCS